MDTSLFHGNLVTTSRILYTPSTFAKTSLLHLQEIGSLQAQESVFLSVFSGALWIWNFGISGKISCALCRRLCFFRLP